MKKRGIMFVLFSLIMLTLAYASTFLDVSQSDFNLGTYNNTVHNGTGVVLSGANVSGTYTSRIFDASSLARLDNLTYSGNKPNIGYIFSIDNQADIWKSSDQGVNWALVKDDYNGADGNGVTTSFFNTSKSYFIVYNQDVWASQDSGSTWIKVNDSYNGAEGQNAYVAAIDRNNNIFIIEGDQDVWKSSNSGSTWTKISTDFNGGNGNFFGFVADINNNLYAVDNQADIWKSSNQGVNWTLAKDDYNGAKGNNADGMAIDSNNTLYILDLQDIWKSSDLGVTWIKINDDFNGASDNENAKSIITDSNNYVYIIDGGEDVFESIDGGTTFTQVATNYNGANLLTPTMASLITETNLTFQVRNCSSIDCSDGTWQNINLNNINLTGRYFQYKSYFTTQEGGLTALLYNVSIDYTILDNIPPSFSNYLESPINNSAYTLGQVYRFNVTINETNPGSVWIEFNGTNYTNGITNISDVYMFNMTGLAAGTYSYKWWANDSLGNINNSGMRYYAISKADNNLTLLSSVGWTSINYGTEATFNCSAAYGTSKLYINNTEVSNPVSLILGFGVHNVKCNISETDNYSGSDGMSQGSLEVNKASSQTSLIFDKTSPQIYGASIIPNCSVISGVGTANLTLNGNAITSGQALTLGAGTWNFNCSLAESQNYSSSSNFSQITINTNSTTTNLIANPGSGIDYGTESNFSCSNSAGFEAILYINGINKNNEKGLNVLRAAGDYIINCSFAGNQNYSASSEQISYAINKTTGNISFWLNGQENNITIDYPQQYNITATTLYGSVFIYFNGTDITANNSLNATPARSAGYYNITAVSSGDGNHSSYSITRWLNVTLDVIAPELQIISPQEGGSYGYNTSLPLNFSVSDEHLDSCWYNLNKGANVTLANCDNSIFNAGSDASYTIYLYANDTLGNLQVKNSTFSILVGSPTIILNSPVGIYLNSQNITFRYTPSDTDLGSCELWGNFDGEFKLNRTDNSLTNGTENTFALNLPDGTYLWNIKCNDSQGHAAFNGNKTFYIDTIAPNITIADPAGTKTSRTGIPAQFSIFDNSPTMCWYNVKYTTNQEVLGNTTIANCSSTSFGVSTDGDYILTLYVKDFANNINSASSSFSVDTSTPVSPPSSGSSGGGGGGGGGGSMANVTQLGKLSVSLIGDVIAREGDKKTFSLNVKNIGKIFLNNCRLIAKGDISSWIYSTNIYGIAPGQNVDFVFDLNVPEETATEINMGSLEVKCEEASNIQNMSISMPKESGLIEIKDIKQEENILKINYAFDSSNFVGENIDIEIWLADENGTEINRIVDRSPINKEGWIDKNVEMQLPPNLGGGVYSLYFAFSNDADSFVKKSVVLGVTGRAILDSEKGKFGVYIIFLLIITVAIFFIWRRHGKEEPPKNKELLRKKAEVKSSRKMF